MRLRSRIGSLIGALVGALVVMSVPTPALAAAAPVQPAAAAPVPAGSYLAVVERGPVNREAGGLLARTQRLVLVSATGETRTVYTRKVSRTYGGFLLLDWSVDGRTALLTTTEKSGAEVISVDVETGATQELALPLYNSAVLDPAGTGILATQWRNKHSNKLVLDRISWSGAATRLLDSTSGALTAGRNGTVLTGDGKDSHVQVLLSTTTGAVTSRFRSHGYCTPVRWWDQSRMLEWCGRSTDLFLVDPTTGAAQRLTSRHGTGDYGHLDARQVGHRLYVQVAGACGYTYVGRVTGTGDTKHLRVPGAVGNVLMIDAVGKNLVLEHAASCDGARPRAVLSLFDPTHHTEKPLLTLGRHEDFAGIRVLGEVRSSTY